MIRYRAAWVLPIGAPPIRDGWVAVEGGRVSAVGGGKTADGAGEVDLGSVALMPGLVNAHTHLELSHLRNAIAPADAFVTWIRAVIAARRGGAGQDPASVRAGIERGIGEAVSCGTAVVGDISNSLATIAPLNDSPLSAVVFYELIRFNAPDPSGVVEQATRDIERAGATGRVRVSLAAHAPYSVAPSVFRAIAASVTLAPSMPCSVHLSESAAEMEFIRAGTGPWRELLEEMGSWDPAWVPPGGSPVAFLDDCGFLHPRTLAVHGVHITTSDLARLKARGTTLVTCPRSNAYTGAGLPPVEEFYESGVPVAIGTDSLASTPDLNVFAELAALRGLAPTVPASALLESATRQGARALGFDADFGTIAPGRSARIIAVHVPADVVDVEEYLVGGIQPDRIRWIDPGLISPVS